MKIYTKVSAVIEKDNKILLIKEWSNKKNGHFWNLIKGTYGDVENETLAECAIREAKEEAGIEISIEKIISCYAYAEELVGLQFNFLAHPKGGSDAGAVNKKDQEKRGEDIIETRWVTKEELLKIKPDEFISKRIYQVIEEWSKGKSYSFETLTSLE